MRFVIALSPDDRQPVGIIAIAVYGSISGRKAWVEDLVVDEDQRGRRIGATLLDAAVQHAKESGCDSVNLTSRPAREAANHLYVSFGFQKRETNTYEMKL